MKNKTICSLAILAALSACQKENHFINCQPVLLLSDKFTKDSVFIKTDTLMKERIVCGADLDSIKVHSSYWNNLCSIDELEHLRYIIHHN